MSRLAPWKRARLVAIPKEIDEGLLTKTSFEKSGGNIPIVVT